MVRRKIYFWMERLQINPAERKAVSLLLGLLVIFATVNGVLKQSAPFDETYYAGLDEAFEQRAALVKQKEEKLRARYQPGRSAPLLIAADTLEDDSLEAKDNRAQPEQEASDRININTANAGQLETLPGIGPVYARRIIEYRTKNGPFTTVEELIQIKGIGKKRLEKLKPFVKLEGVNLE